jgi:hypothetical protein
MQITTAAMSTAVSSGTTVAVSAVSTATISITAAKSSIAADCVTAAEATAASIASTATQVDNLVAVILGAISPANQLLCLHSLYCLLGDHGLDAFNVIGDHGHLLVLVHWVWLCDLEIAKIR